MMESKPYLFILRNGARLIFHMNPEQLQKVVQGLKSGEYFDGDSNGGPFYIRVAEVAAFVPFVPQQEKP